MIFLGFTCSLKQNSIFSSKIGFDLKYAVVTVTIDSGWEQKNIQAEYMLGKIVFYQLE